MGLPAFVAVGIKMPTFSALILVCFAAVFGFEESGVSYLR